MNIQPQPKDQNIHYLIQAILAKYLKIKTNHWRENLKNLLIEYKNTNNI